jgi:hypothetical protein
MIGATFPQLLRWKVFRCGQRFANQESEENYSPLSHHFVARCRDASHAGERDRSGMVAGGIGGPNIAIIGRKMQMPNIQAQIARAKEQLKHATEDLEAWESFEAVTATDEKGKSFNVRAEMITRRKLNMLKYRAIIAALEKQAEKSN